MTDNGDRTLAHLNALAWLEHNSHGHAFQRKDGLIARCFGIEGCGVCKAEEMLVEVIEEAKSSFAIITG